MSCEDLILAEDVNTLCADLLGKYKESGFVYDYNDIDRDSTIVDDGKVKLSLKNGATGIRVYDRSFNPFSGVTRTSEENDRYVVYHDQAILPLFVNNQINAKLLNVLGLKKIVIVLEHMKTGTSDEGKYPIFGLMGGLLENSSARTDIVAAEVTMMDMNTGYPALFLSIDGSSFLESYLPATLAENGASYVNGGYVEAGDTIAYGITGATGLNAKICLPDGTVQSTGSGYSAVWSGDAGNVRIVLNDKVQYINSTGTGNDIFSSNFAGEVEIIAPTDIKRIHVPNASSLVANGMTGLISLICDNATVIDLSGGALSTKVVAEMITGVYNSGNINGDLDLSGGTNPTYAQLNAAYPDAAALLTALDNARGWAITLNT